MNLTLEKLEELDACEEGIDWFTSQKETDLKKVCKSLLKENKFGWVNWLVCRLLNLDNKKRYAIHAASSVLHIFEDKYPDDKRPRKALKAASKYLENKSLENLESLKIAAYDAAATARAAYAASHAADAACAYAAYAAADVAVDASYAAAAYAASYAAYAAYAYAAYAAADVAVDASYAAVYAAAASHAATAAYAYAHAAANAAANAAVYAGVADSIRLKIINYGLKLISEQEK